MTLRGEVLAIGDELLHGALLDTNSKWIAQQLEAVGVPVVRFTVASDEPEVLRDAMAQACARADIVIATGGLGPTLDDRTRDVAASLQGQPLAFDERSWQVIRAYLGRRCRPVPESNRRQAMFPVGATVIDNPVGTAPAFSLRIGRGLLFALPGVPREMQTLMRDAVLPAIRALPGLTPTAQHWLRLVGPSEALLGERIAAFMVPGRNPAVGVTVSAGLLTVRIVATAPALAAAQAACAVTADDVRPLVAEWLIAEGLDELPHVVAARLLATDSTIAVAESCTGGLLAATLTDIAGISAVFLGGVVAYANAVKERQLGVDPELLAAHGAVSEPVAAAMAAGVAERMGATLGVSITGIAGPGGGTTDKPVGTVCFGLCQGGSSRAWTVKIPDLGREFIRERAVIEVLVALLRATRGT
ncbi:MAG: competence/damage-inducible protein A [Planctomycetes bacterium]|nr:competence/damage-inducible protein A [Planctomycetota bacterium]